MPLFDKILIANRGEIACRVMRTAKRLGIKTVAVYSDADANAPHVRQADEAFRLGPAAAKDSYLRHDIILQIAQQCGAQAVHPGYGFLSENETFAQACAQSGIVFIGPPVEAIAAMGSKSAAKTLMEKAGVPLVPGYHGDNQDSKFLEQQATRIGYPVLIKASAGGGGKGMRIVTQAQDFAAALISCKRESLSSFGDDRVLIEAYVSKPRHIEVQVFADTLGNTVYLFERDCSVQRRHQKVIEEAPAPGMSHAMRVQMGEAAVAAAKSVGYVGAGTVEFIAQAASATGSQSGSTPQQFYFMEMNTRLQVEHPVTEMICGVDLVEWQLRVAAGERLPLLQHELCFDGHAIEARIYSENPYRNFLPATGAIDHLRTPTAVQFTTGQVPSPTGQRMQGTPSAVRIDSGIEQGGAISPFYDPMIAKLIVWGPTRASATAQMLQSLQQFEVAPLVTNIEFLQDLMRCESFKSADLDTGLIERERSFLLDRQTATPAQVERNAVLTAAAILAQESTTPISTSADPWQSTHGFRLYQPYERTIELTYKDTPVTVICRYASSGFTLQVKHASGVLAPIVCLANPRLLKGQLHATLGSETVSASVFHQGTSWTIFNHAVAHVFELKPHLSWTAKAQTGSGSVTAPMPGKIVALLAPVGSPVTAGQALVVMEAMKMEHTLSAPTAGVLQEYLCQLGDQVSDGAQLLRLEQAAPKT